MEKKRVVIIGAGVSGLAVCKHLLERGCQPVVFEAGSALGGVWARVPDCTELQTPRPMYQYSDFPWPESVTQVFPDHRQVVAYLEAYARHFGVLGCIRFGHRVVGMEYDGVAEEAVAAWGEWAGNGQAFGSGDGEWRLSVADAEGHVEMHTADFVVLCIGRFSGVPSIPTFPAGKGPEAFDGQVIHSMEYAKMGTTKAKEMIRGKRVTVVGYLKSALDIAAECAEVNGIAHPCTMVVRTKHWIIPDYFAWGVHISKLYLNRFSELLIHKPGEGFLLSLLATLLTPLRWAFSKFAESYYSIPMKKFDMVPDHSLFDALAACLIAITPKDHYKRLEEGSIVLKKSKTFSFCKEGVIVREGESSLIKSDIVIFGTGFKGDEKIKDIFTSEYFRSIAVGSTSTTVPLYRECIHPKIPQLAVIGYSESISNLYTSEIRAKWLAHFMDGGFTLPNITAMQKDVIEWEKYMKRYSGRYFRRSGIAIIHTWYNDQLCRDMGCNPRRKKGFFKELFEVYGPGDYVDLRPKKE
ncbi:hypothetical protein SETIT_9G266400v2 [Setaria italica]|uniref:Flavin-containing monooxygenase n=1 Tax=Setaria italica TaxID=4555 RepID=K4A8H2_SETIT|nr:probable flavin-containing monooxygenase 1 [Setaria italica]RCV43070.1 hypothetical protein SETIT_9G266400v2 [Setaria italica]